MSDMILARIRNEFELFGKSRPTRNLGMFRGFRSNNFVRGLPMTFNYHGAFETPMGETFQRWLFAFEGDNSMSLEEKIVSWHGLMKNGRAFTDHEPVGEGTLLPFFDPAVVPAIHNILTGGETVIRLLSRNWERYKGTRCYRFQVINTKDPDYWRIYAPWSHPHLFFIPFNSVRQPIIRDGKWTGRYDESRAEPFHWFRSKSIIPLHSYGTNFAYIDMNLVRML